MVLRDALNAIFVVGAQAAKLVYLLGIPIILSGSARQDWGTIAIGQSTALFVALAVEYGFNVLGVQTLSHLSRDHAHWGEFTAGAFAARLTIAGLIAAVTVALALTGATSLWGSASLLLAAVSSGIAYGFLPVWHFHIRGQLYLVSMADIVINLGCAGWAYAAVILDAPLVSVIMVQFVLTAAALVVMLGMMSMAEVRITPDLGESVRYLRKGASLFFLNLSVGAYSAGNVVAIGALFGAPFAAIYANAERIVRTAVAMPSALVKIVWPRFAALAAVDERAHLRRAEIYAASGTVLSVIVALALYLSAKPLISVLYGPQYSGSTSVLRVLSLAVVFITFNNLVAYLILLPLGLQRVINTLTILSSLVNFLVLAGSSLGGFYSAAWALVCTEAFGSALLLVYVRRRRLHG